MAFVVPIWNPLCIPEGHIGSVLSGDRRRVFGMPGSIRGSRSRSTKISGLNREGVLQMSFGSPTDLAKHFHHPCEGEEKQ